MTTVYRITDPYDKTYEWFGDQDDIIDFLHESQIPQEVFTEAELKEKGWVWGLEQAGLTFEEIYDKEA